MVFRIYDRSRRDSFEIRQDPAFPPQTLRQPSFAACIATLLRHYAFFDIEPAPAFFTM
jgi:hypothetical protein